MKEPMFLGQRRRRQIIGAVALALLMLTIPAGWALSQWAPVNWRLKVLQAELRDALFPHPETLPTPVHPPQLALIRSTTPTAWPTVRPREQAKTDVPLSTASPIADPQGRATRTPALAGAVALTGFTHQYQTWNNCGPATLTTALTYFGRPERQAEAAALLKPDPDDKNVSPDEMAAYVRQLGYGVTVRVGGTLEQVKRLLANDFPVIVEKGFEPDPGDGWMGHYLLLTGYDDAQSMFITQDSYIGPDRPAEYAEVEKYWRQFNRLFIVPYPLDKASELEALIGGEDPSLMNEKALATAQVEAGANPAEAFAWFNMGTNLTRLGRYDEAAAAFDQARLAGLPWRMLWYQFGPYEAYFQVGRYEDVIALAQATVDVTDNLEESHYWLGLAQLAAGRGTAEDARREFELALLLNPNFALAREALANIP